MKHASWNPHCIAEDIQFNIFGSGGGVSVDLALEDVSAGGGSTHIHIYALCGASDSAPGWLRVACGRTPPSSPAPSPRRRQMGLKVVKGPERIRISDGPLFSC